MPISKPAIGDPTKKSLADDIIDALAALDIDIAAVLGERMVNNGSFEVDTDADNIPDGWETTPYSGGTQDLVEDAGAGTLSAHGLRSYKFTHPGGGGNGGGEIYTAAGTYIEITPNRGYWISWLNKNSVAGVTNSVEVLEYDATQSLIGSPVVIFSATTNPTSWKQLRAIYYPTSALCRYVRLKFKCGETSASTAGDIYIDNVEMARVPRQTTVLETVGSWKWTCPPGVRFIELELIGGGGGGGGCNSSGTGGGGGGAGAYLYANIAVTPGTTYDFAIGAGGTSSGTTSGTNGGNTTLTVGATTYTAAGGTGGTRGSSGGAGGAGGAATNGDTNTTGVSGGSGTGAPAAGSGGYAAPFSFFAGTNSAGTTGSNGPTYGAGGSGGRTGTDAGGSGASGVAIIRW